jgi:short-subunit dehydrogenase
MRHQSSIFAASMGAFANKVVWITGASSGIGSEMAQQFSLAGARLVLSARREEALQNLRDTLAFPEKVLVLPLDLTKPGSFAEAVKQVLELMGGIDILVNNAGISQRSYVVDTDLSVDRSIMEINYFGTIALSKAVLPQMLKQGHGHFVVVTSIVGKLGFGVRSAYAASKHALHGFFESLHIELHHRGIRVTLLCPGPVQTPISIHALDGSGKPSGVMDEMQLKGMPVDVAVRTMIKGIQHQEREVIVGSFTERLGVKLKAWWPAQFFKLALKQNPRGTVKIK